MARPTARRFAANGSLPIIEVDVFGRHLHHFDGGGPTLLVTRCFGDKLRDSMDVRLRRR